MTAGATMPVIRIGFLADHPRLIPTLARWHHEEWRELIPEWSLEEAERELALHTGRAVIPTTLVALAGDRLAGSASLLVDDLPEWPQFTPWVASVFVAPEWRGRQVGTRLVNRAVEVAGLAGAPRVYLVTPGQEAFYRRIGWSVVEVPRNPARPVTVMTRSTRAGGT
jgi:predicted N-acetyltransferase YhbS